MSIAPKYPLDRHWEALNTYLNLSDGARMTLEEFLRFWNVTREELAYICDCSLTTVNHWFSQGDHRRVPNEKHEQRLALAHHTWTTVETEPEYLQTLREMYHRNRRRTVD